MRSVPSARMEYVMVPVPEELVAEVKDYLDWNLATKGTVEPNADALRQVWDDTEPTIRTILRYTAEHCADDDPPHLLDVAREADVSSHTLMGMLIETNTRLRELGGPPMLVLMRPDVRERPADVREWDHKRCAMAKPVAEQILAL